MFNHLTSIDAPDMTGFDATEMELLDQEKQAEDADGNCKTDLPNEIIFDEKDVRRSFHDARRTKSATAAIERIPGPKQARHLIIGGHFALFDCLPAVLELAGQTAAEATIATLGFSKLNVAALCKLLDAGALGRLVLACSKYFAATSKPVWATADAELRERRQQTLLTARTHAKILAVRLADGRTVTIESSANLRSCRNVEQITVYGCPRLYEFHSNWIKGLAAK